MKPIVPPKYDIGFIVKNCNVQLLETLEPWCSTIYTDGDYITYQKQESLKTSFDLDERIKPYDNEKNNAIFVEIDGSNISQQDFQIIQQLSEIIQDSGEIGRFKLGNLVIEVIQLNTYENNLIINEG